MRFETYKTLKEVVAGIREIEEEYKSMIWNNDAGDWDLEDIETNSEIYDEVVNEYILDTMNYDITSGSGAVLFRFEGFDL